MSSPIDPNPATFDSYEDYVEYIESTALYDRSFDKTGEDYRFYREDIWLARFTGPERSAQWCRYWDDSAEGRNQPPTVPVNEHSKYDTVTDSTSFQTLLKTFNEQTKCQVLILALDHYGALQGQTINILGLGLDMPPEAWMILRRIGDVSFTSWMASNGHTTAWTPNYPVLNIGDHSILVLDAVPGIRLKTGMSTLKSFVTCKYTDLNAYFGIAIVLLANKAKTRLYETREFLLARLRLPYRSFLSASQKGPIASRRKSLSRDLQPSPSEGYDTWMLRSYLTIHGGGTIEKFGPGNDLFVSFAALLQLHISKPSRNIPSWERVDGKINLKYYERSGDKEFAVWVDPQAVWVRLRKETDAHRRLLEWLPYQVEQYFGNDSIELKAALSEWTERLKLHLREIELAEAALRDYISIYSSGKSTEMAEQSIKESKRVILRRFPAPWAYTCSISRNWLTPSLVTALAFIFLPISLSASIYGMVSAVLLQ